MHSASSDRPRDEGTVISVKSGAAPIWMLALLTTLLLVPPVLHGAPLADALRMWAFLLAYVAVPGALIYDRMRAQHEDLLLGAGMAWALGFSFEAIVYLGCKMSGIAHLFALYPAVVLLLELVRRRARKAERASEPAPRITGFELGALLIVLLLVVLRTPYYPRAEWWTGWNEDLLFHAGNAAELKNNWPMLDPRCAGQPLVYHFFSYALPASASTLTGLPVSDVMYGVGAFVGPVFLALQIYNAAKLFARSSLAGVIAATLVMMHVDYGRALAFALERMGVGGDEGLRLSFNSYLHVGIYASISTSSGLFLFATLAILLHRWYAEKLESPIRTALCMALVAGVASGVKGSIMPVVLGGLGIVFAWNLVRRRTWDLRTLCLLIVLTLAALPMTIFLSSGEHTYVASMFHIEPGAAIRDSDTFRTVFASMGGSADDLGLVALLSLLPVWLAGYLDLIGAGALLYWLSEKKRMERAPALLYAMALAGAGAALVTIASDLSQMFFLYTAQIGLAILAGAGLARFARPRTPLERKVAVLLVIVALPLVGGSLHEAWTRVTKPAAAVSTEALAYGEGLRWMRAELPPDAVVVAAHPAIVISAFAERRALYETDRFTPAGHAAGWKRTDGHWHHELAPGKAHPEYAALGKQVCTNAPAIAIEHTRKLLAPNVPLYVVRDDVRLAGDGAALEFAPREPFDRSEIPAGWTLEFSNDVVHVYRVKPL